MKYYIFGCIALGITTGYLVGSSSSPVVQYVLPLLFALLVSSASIFALKSTLSATSHEGKLRLVGVTASALTIPFLLATIYGTLVRTGSSFSSLIPDYNRKDNFITSDIFARYLLTEDILKIKLIDINLSAAGVESKERNIITNLIAQRRATEIKKFFSIQSELANRLMSSAGELEKLIQSKKDDESSSSSIEKLFAQTSVLAKILTNETTSISEKIKSLSSVKASMLDVLSEAEVQKNKTLMVNLVTLYSTVDQTPDIEVINTDLRQEIISLLKITNVKTASIFEPTPNLASTDRPFGFRS